MMLVVGKEERKEKAEDREEPSPDGFGLVMAASPSGVQTHDAGAFRSWLAMYEARGQKYG
jgi:hypothetical protein